MQLDHLRSLLPPDAVLGQTAGIEITSVHHDSRNVVPGGLFCCVSGDSLDGHDFAEAAIALGAAALLVDHRLEVHVPQLLVGRDRLRSAMAVYAQAVAGFPARQLLTCGVTGTNAKTTVTQMLGTMAQRAGFRSTVIGTLSGSRTTPEAPVLAGFLADARDEALASGDPGFVAMEVSSHALSLHRVDGVTFDVCAFTNLSHDHLDFHGTMENYYQAKASLFTPERCRHAVVFVDDPYGARLADEVQVPLTVVQAADASEVLVELGHSSFTWRGQRATMPLTGRLNVHNALVAMTAASALGFDEEAIVAGLAEVSTVAGRLELVAPTSPDRPTVLVDYAHTPAGLEAVLSNLRQLIAPEARLHVVFGCGGDRDRAKRPLMGEVAARLADQLTVTSDNPRSEDPAAIAAAIVDGIPKRMVDHVVVELDRVAAITTAIGRSSAGDVVLIAGKGHEAVQETRGVKVPLSDVEVARQALEGWQG